MDHLWPLKKEFNPFGRLFYGISAIGFLLRITQCTMHSCPYRRGPFKITWAPSNSLLGSGDRVCWRCKQVFWDRSNGWPEMSSEERSRFLVPITVGGYLAAVLVIAGLLFVNFWYVKLPANRIDSTVVIILFLPIVPWFAFRSVQVIRSIRRYNNRGKTSTL